ncbi:hypothetical protein QR680_014268 [Steinernema hermaphroditum]|uniref:Uncharacterized protein n=1 Tax=Steinernema hermaphroditum TaxID=289476 RepID=A0AA39M3Y4_9BILA|nr:hypothetical protein QR680_014268 [Steinernema hermaphroditum]
MAAPSILLVLLWIPVFLADNRFNRRFKGGKLTVNIYGYTSNCHKAGTDSTVTASLNYVNLEDKLLYTIFSPAMVGSRGDNLESGTTFQVKHVLKEDVYKQVEKACYDNAAWPLWNQTIYEDCFHPNILYFQMEEHGFGPAWKPGQTTAELWYRLKDGGDIRKETFFMVHPNCEVDWVGGAGDYYVCRDEPSRWNEYLRKGSAFDKYTKYVCDHNKRRLRRITDTY